MNEEQLEIPGIGTIKQPEPAEERHLLQVAMLKSVIDPEDIVLIDYVDVVGPQMLEHFSLLSAKGSSDPRWEHNPDQSMLAHILNGVFPTLRIVKTAGQLLDDREERIYLVGYTFHDLDKLTQVRRLSVADLEKVEQFYSYLENWIQTLQIHQFFPEYQQYLGDIAYLILNTQTVYGTNLNLPGYDLKLRGRRRDFLREMCICSDKVAYFLKSPNAFLERPDLVECLNKLSNGSLQFAYHKISENRGMITNVINNALLRLLRDEIGWKPLLFFPVGVTYLKEREMQEAQLPTLENVAKIVETRLVDYCKERLRNNLNGFSRDGKGFKFADFYYDFFKTKELLYVIHEGCFRKIPENKFVKPQPDIRASIRKWQERGKIRNSVEPSNCPASAGRLAKLLDIQELIEMPSKIEYDSIFKNMDILFELDTRVDQLAEYLDQIEKVVGEIIGREIVAEKISEILGMMDLRTDFQAVPRDTRAGGVPLHWYFLAGKYLSRYRGLDNVQMRELLENVAQSVCDHFSDGISEHDTQRTGFPALREYVKQLIDINGNDNLQRDFKAELDRYIATKKTGRGSDKGCSLCSSSFATTEQSETSVTFAPQVYSGKNPLGSTRLKRGICELCSIEMMLRQIMMRTKLNLVGGDYDNVKIKWLYLYPSYFFTTETGRFARSIYNQLRNLNFFDVRRHLHEGMEIKNFLTLDEVLIAEELDPADDPILKMEFEENDLATFYFCGIPTLGKNPTDTESWVLPTFLGLLLPIVFNAKVVVTESPIPLYPNGEEWRETVILDAPHSFVTHILPTDKLRIDQIHPALKRTASLYDVNIDVFQDGPDPGWNHLNEVARNVDTDAFYVFHYFAALQRKNKWDFFPKPKEGELSIPCRYLKTYEYVGGANMSLIEGVAERCFAFYGPSGFVTHAILRMVTLVEDVIINSDPKISADDLKYEARGEIGNLMERIGRDAAQGYRRLPLKDGVESEAIREFVDYFYTEVFLNYCEGERAILRDRRNRFNAGVTAWYHENWRKFIRQTNPDNQLSG
ncbi:type I-D CRISPR-associated protein Cas10d/Csc3 [Candidatus Poribacteria bacterium]|nr:type I-D CRISPR-associated protein Cas10d/Csc3 [Candidatus Poribacteria bacterium]